MKKKKRIEMIISFKRDERCELFWESIDTHVYIS